MSASAPARRLPLLEQVVAILAELSGLPSEDVWQAAEPSPRCDLAIALRRLRRSDGARWSPEQTCAALQALEGIASCQARKARLELLLEPLRLLEEPGLPAMRAPEPPVCLVLPDTGWEGLRCLLVGTALLRIEGFGHGSLVPPRDADASEMLAGWNVQDCWQSPPPQKAGLLIFRRDHSKLPAAIRRLQVGPVVARGRPAPLLTAAAEHARGSIVSRKPAQAAASLARSALSFQLLRNQPGRPAELPRREDGRCDLEALLSYEGDSAAFLLCQRARCRLLGRRLDRATLAPGIVAMLGEEELPLLRACWRYREVFLPYARRRLSPACLAEGLLELARAFARCDTRSSLFDSPAGCTALAALAGETLACLDAGLGLLGLEPLDLL